MSGLVLTLPITAGKVEAWRRFCQELSGSRRPHLEASRRRLGITCERLALAERQFGSSAVATLQAHDVGLALAEMIRSERLFDSWYRERWAALHGIKLTHYQQYAWRPLPAGPHELLFEWMLSGSAEV